MLLHRAGDDSITELAATGIPMGVMADLSVPTAEPIALAGGDQFLILTDGFFEYADTGGEQFGIERVGQWLRQTRALPAREAILDLRGRVVQFAAGAGQADDLTAVLIRRE
jgi:serine phosphatase RsbU (regulator of sigma subunit)